MEAVLNSKTLVEALEHYDNWLDRDYYGATVGGVAQCCREGVPTAELRAELDAWESGTPINPSSELLVQAAREGFEDLVTNLVARVPVTEQCLDVMIYEFNENILRILLSNVGEITDGMLRSLTHPKLIPIAIPYLNNVDPERVVLNCESWHLLRLGEYGFDLSSPRLFSAVLARNDTSSLDLLDHLAAICTCAVEDCRESEWYWKRRAPVIEKRELIDSLQSDLRLRVSALLFPDRPVARAPEQFGQSEANELPLLPVWMVITLLDSMRCYGSYERPAWRDDKAKTAFEEYLHSVPAFYSCELSEWRILW